MPRRDWTFVTNHGAVLAVIARTRQITAGEIASTLGMTERPVRRIIAELQVAGYLEKTRVGARNYYRVNATEPLRLPAARDIAVGELLKVLKIEPNARR